MKTLEVIPIERFTSDAQALKVQNRIDELVESGKINLAKKMVKHLYYSYGIDIGLDGGREIIGDYRNY